MANTTARLYIRTKSGYTKLPKKPTDLPEGENYQLTWYEANKKKSCNVGRFCDAAQVAQINKEAELRRANITPAVPATVVPPSTPAGVVSTKERSFTDSMTQYLKEVRLGKSKKTFLAYAITLKNFAKVCKAATIEAMTRQDVVDYTQAMRDAGLTPRTQSNRLAFLRTFFFHFDLKWPMKTTDKVRYTEKTVTMYSPQQLQALFAACDQEEYELFQFFLVTGVREQEAMYAAWSDLDFHTKKFNVTEKLGLGFTPKDKEEGGIPVPDEFLDLMKERRKRYPNTRLIFPMPNGKLNGHMLRTLKELAFREGFNCGGCYNKAGQCCKDAPICHKWILHRFRKTFATMHHRNGVPVRTIQAWLRHSSLDTTLRYLADSDDESEQTRTFVNGTFVGLRKAKSTAA